MSLFSPVLKNITKSLSKLRSRSLSQDLDESYIPPSGTVRCTNDTLDLSTTPISRSLAQKWWDQSEEGGVLDSSIFKVEGG